MRGRTEDIPRQCVRLIDTVAAGITVREKAMLRWIGALVIILLAACSDASSPAPAGNGASDTFERDMNNVTEASRGKTCGPAPLAGWPPRPLKDGVVIDAERARSLGLVYLWSIYGKKTITLPLTATLKDGVWTIVDAGPGEGAIGGEHYVTLCQSSGAVLVTYKTQ